MPQPRLSKTGWQQECSQPASKQKFIEKIYTNQIFDFFIFFFSLKKNKEKTSNQVHFVRVALLPRGSCRSAHLSLIDEVRPRLVNLILVVKGIFHAEQICNNYDKTPLESRCCL